MRHGRTCETCQHFHRFPARPAKTGLVLRAFRIGDRVRQFVQAGDGDVEGKEVNVSVDIPVTDLMSRTLAGIETAENSARGESKSDQLIREKLAALKAAGGRDMLMKFMVNVGLEKQSSVELRAAGKLASKALDFVTSSEYTLEQATEAFQYMARANLLAGTSKSVSSVIQQACEDVRFKDIADAKERTQAAADLKKQYEKCE